MKSYNYLDEKIMITYHTYLWKTDVEQTKKDIVQDLCQSFQVQNKGRNLAGVCDMCVVKIIVGGGIIGEKLQYGEQYNGSYYF